MDDKELENMIKTSADEIEMKDFSQRWAEIKDRLPIEKKRIRVSMKHILAIASSVAILILAVVLPIALLPSNESHYFTVNDVVLSGVSKEEFYSELGSTKLEIVNFQQYNFDEYFLGRTDDSIARGGRVIYNNENGESEFLFSVTFFSAEIIIDESEYADLEDEMVVEGVAIRYKTNADELFENKAMFSYNEVNYFVDYTSLNDDLASFLEQLF